MRDVEKAAGFLNLFADNVSAGMDVEPAGDRRRISEEKRGENPSL